LRSVEPGPIPVTTRISANFPSQIPGFSLVSHPSLGMLAAHEAAKKSPGFRQA
jgi:hypothetical protein